MPSGVSYLESENALTLFVCLFFNLLFHFLLYFAGFTLNTADYREKEDMYDEIIRLKKVSFTKIR